MLVRPSRASTCAASRLLARTSTRCRWVPDPIRTLNADCAKTVLLVEHEMGAVRELADRIVVRHDSRLAGDG